MVKDVKDNKNMSNEVKFLYSKNELISLVSMVEKPNLKLTEIEEKIFIFLETELCSFVSKLVEERKESLTKLKFFDLNKTLCVWNGDYLTSCRICIFDKFTPIRTSSKCQLSCNFCYFKDKPTLSFLTKNEYGFMGNYFSKDSLKVCLDKQKDFVKGISWVSEGEPLLEIDKIKEMMPYISSLNIYQWMNTNGILISEEVLKLLRYCGLNELRFNLQATNFNENTLKNLYLSKKFIEHVVVETPMFGATFDNYKNKIKEMADNGIKNYNIPELQIFLNNFNYFTREGLLYKHNMGYVSPISSLMFIYDLLEIVEKDNIDITINVCSNNTKFYRGISNIIPSEINYKSYIKFLPVTSYLFIIEHLFKNTKLIKIF